MADYYPLIARAVEGLTEQTPAARHAVYERARTALVAQLRSLDPPLSEADIRKECASLDEAITRVETDHAPPPAGFDPDAFAEMVAEDQRQQSPADRLRSVMPPRQPLRAPSQVEPEPAPHAFGEEAPVRPRIDSRPHPAMQSNRQMRSVLLGAAIVFVILVIGGLAWWQSRSDAPIPETPVAETPQEAPASNESAKIDERVGGQAPAVSPNADQAIGVAHRAVFYEEDATNPQTPKAHVGRVVWRLEDVNPGQGQSLEKAVTANVEIAEAGLTMKMVLRRNLDTTLPASHTIELTFTTREGDSGRVIRDVGLLQFKNEEAARGTPIAGLPVPVRENLFLIGLSNLQGDVERNTELFVRRNWIDLPVRMASGQRAILSFEKGATGEQVLTSAFSQWQ
ncbi:histidine kinase [Microvirga makkahensis]|uniref:Histidine kinase n=1 Tax=Microvirga makkahensis TaxID=1128670 RepID=A0A7X3SQV8_9HYPH|nr:histidine kinase [Microvirga makkahensis]MXQ13971.1 histidine kinase [Microvirga makkahensis]